MLKESPATMSKTAFKIALEKTAGVSIESLRTTLLDERRILVEKKLARPMTFFPKFVGRYFYSLTVNREEVEKTVNKAIS